MIKPTLHKIPHNKFLVKHFKGISEDASVNLPAIGHMRRTIRNQRRMNQRPGNPANRAAIPEIPMVYHQTANNEQFLLFDSGFGEDNRMLIFASNQAIQLLARSED